MTNFNMIFHVVVSVNRLVKIETRPSFLLNFGTANSSVLGGSDDSVNKT